MHDKSRLVGLTPRITGERSIVARCRRVDQPALCDEWTSRLGVGAWARSTPIDEGATRFEILVTDVETPICHVPGVDRQDE
jgi:hypothetical protein